MDKWKADVYLFKYMPAIAVRALVIFDQIGKIIIFEIFVHKGILST